MWVFQSRSGRLTRQISILPLSGFEASTTQSLPNQYMDYDLFCLWPTSVLLGPYYLQMYGNVNLPLFIQGGSELGISPVLLFAGYEDAVCGES